ncbi:hypothetical protein HDU98_007675 [Podochytrium sp. JEL0797]|nr:hypothetical protein HDU98_007675 [Podochytrium sp. JEL0797]
MEQDLSAVLDDSDFRRSKSPTGLRVRTPYERPAQSQAPLSAHDDQKNDRMHLDGDIDAAPKNPRARVYVGNLAYEVGWQDLKDYMRKCGEVIFADVLTMPGGRSKGCGVVEYATPEEADRAIRELNDTPLMGRQVFVREDREPDVKFAGSRDRGMPMRGGGGGGGVPNPAGVFVSNLPYIVAWQDMKDLFRQAGNVVRADIHMGPDQRSKGTGIVGFDSATDAQNAISMFNGYDWHGRKIEVRESFFLSGDDGDLWVMAEKHGCDDSAGHTAGDLGSRSGGGDGDFGGRPYMDRGPGGPGGPDRGCFKCGRPGHRARECREGGGGGYGGPPRRDDRYDQGRGYGGPASYDRGGYGGPRGGAPYYDNRGGGYGGDNYYGGGGGGGRGGYGGPPGGGGGYRDYPPPGRGYGGGGDYNRGPPPMGNGGGPYNDYPPQQGGPRDYPPQQGGPRDYPPAGGPQSQGPNIYGDFR